MSNSGAVISLKLLINTESKQVLFAKAGKDFVDFLFCILSLPVGKVIGLVQKQDMLGSLSNLYQSIENLHETYVQPNQTKNNILSSGVANASYDVPLLAVKPAEKRFYRCVAHNCSQSVSDDPLAICPQCNGQMSNEMSYVAPPAAGQASGEGGGFVKGVVTYMVMDDLVVKPLSTISRITMLNTFNVKDLGSLEEKVVDFGLDKAVKLLKGSMETKNVLTSVFLK